MKKLYFLGVGILVTSIIHAQSIKNVQANLNGSNVIISYDLVASEKGQRFDILLKSSGDNFSSALKEVIGDVGANQTAGIGKKITWNARKELGSFKGDISFKITAIVTFTPLKFVKPTSGAGVKIGKPYTVEWKGGTLNRNLKLELLKNNSQVMDIGNIDNSGSYTWNVPKTMKKGEKFQLRLLDPTKPNNAILSAEFKLTKIPMYVYIGAGAAVVGVLAAVLLGGNNGGNIDCATNPTDPACVAINELATPPSPPGGGN